MFVLISINLHMRYYEYWWVLFVWVLIDVNYVMQFDIFVLSRVTFRILDGHRYGHIRCLEISAKVLKVQRQSMSELMYLPE